MKTNRGLYVCKQKIEGEIHKHKNRRKKYIYNTTIGGCTTYDDLKLEQKKEKRSLMHLLSIEFLRISEYTTSNTSSAHYASLSYLFTSVHCFYGEFLILIKCKNKH